MKRKNLLEIEKSVGIFLGDTLLSMAFYHLGFTNANIIMVYILGVLLTSISTSRQIYSLISSIVSVVVFNFLFTSPRYSFTAYETGAPVTFLVMFLTAYITGSFALRYKEQAFSSAKSAFMAQVLFESGQLLSKAADREAIWHTGATQIRKLLARDIVIWPREADGLAPGRYEENHTQSFEPERAMKQALVCMQTGLSCADDAGPGALAYYPLRVQGRTYGVVGIGRDEPLEPEEQRMLLSLLGEFALALENEQNAREKETAAILAQSEQLRANLLRTISHDLRTPLTTISGNASNLIANADCFDRETKLALYTDIYDDAMWLKTIVENLLYATRIEEGHMSLKTSEELLSDIVDEAVAHVARRADEHQLDRLPEDTLMLVRVDPSLMVQVITNLLDNAVKYSPAGSRIVIALKACGDTAQVQISDNGPGIPDAEKSKIFEKFYRGGNRIADNRRSLGLGLYLCKAITEAHGGSITVADNSPTGAVFTVTLPKEEVLLNEVVSDPGR